MPLSLETLISIVRPEKTVLFLGAGASVPSGGPTGAELADFVYQTVTGTSNPGYDLSEVCGILEIQFGRQALTAAVRKRLKKLKPTGGLSVLPGYPWPAIYTTNFDRLIEDAYRSAGNELNTIRSNYEFGRVEGIAGIPLFKIHGCISQDIADGATSRMVLTDADYDAYIKYREALFGRLKLDFISKDVLFIGYSLQDPHLKRQLSDAARIQEESGGTGRLFALIFEHDENRAGLLERKGIRVAFGGIDEFVHSLTSRAPAEVPGGRVPDAGEFPLPPSVRSIVVDVSHSIRLAPSSTQLFNGAPARYADIHAGLTFPRDIEEPILDHLLQQKALLTAIVGVAGVGKTSLARRILFRLSTNEYLC